MLLIAIVFGVVAWITDKTSVFMLAGVTGGLTLLQIFQFFFYRPANNLRIDTTKKILPANPRLANHLPLAAAARICIFEFMCHP